MWFALGTLALTAFQSMQASKANNELSEQNYESAVTSQTYENRGINEGLREDQDIYSDKKLEMMKEAMKAKSTLQARGRSISGADGQSQEITNSLGLAINQMKSTLEGQQRQTDMEKKGTTASAQSRINSIPKTSYNPLMDIASTGLSIGTDFKAAQSAHSAATAGKGKLEWVDWVGGKV